MIYNFDYRLESYIEAIRQFLEKVGGIEKATLRFITWSHWGTYISWIPSRICLTIDNLGYHCVLVSYEEAAMEDQAISSFLPYYLTGVLYSLFWCLGVKKGNIFATPVLHDKKLAARELVRRQSLV
jgi:hypothetical protein